MRYELTVYEKAIGKERPRFNMYQKRTYIPKKTKNYEGLIKMSFYKKYGFKNEPCKNEIHVKIAVYYKPPKSYSKKKSRELIDNVRGYMCKPDVDDKQVVELTVQKYYGTSDKIEIEIEDKEYT